MKGKLAAAVALAAALATAAFVRPPRAAPAFSPATTGPVPRAAGCFACRSERRRSAAKPKSRSPRNRHHRSRKTTPHDVDLNRADAATLARVPGINEGLARRIVAYRDLVGPFESLSDLDDLDGISATRLDTLARYVIVR